MRFIVDNKIYDTNKAELVAEGERQYEVHNKLLNITIYPYRDTQLYRSSKGTLYFVSSDDYKNYIEIPDEKTAKHFLARNNYSKYVELFGEMEEG